MKLSNRILCLILLFLSSNCKEDKKLAEANSIVKEWVGKTIRFPTDFQCNALGEDTTSVMCTGLIEAEYKILLYVDSAGCSSCRLKLFQWQQFIEEADSLFGETLSFLFFFQPKNKKEIEYLFRRDKFDYQVFIDTKNEINRLNHFPNKMEYQCFLLDKNNKVLMIGNPTLNPKIWELYKEAITGEVSTKPLVTIVEPQQTEIEIKDFRLGKTSEAVFALKNTGSQPLVIQMVNASCGCTVPEWEKHPIAPGASTEIKVRITPEEEGYFNKTVTVYCNVEKGVISLMISGKVHK